MTKAQNIAVMNAESSNMRDNANLMIIGVETTQNLALDELFGKKEDTT